MTDITTLTISFEDHIKGTCYRKWLTISSRSVLSQDSVHKGKVIECKADVAWAPNSPLSVETIKVDPMKTGEVRLKVLANALCHTKEYTLSE